ncbi:ChuX/HutX family heme-like substrate-binding protein [Planktotalea sp.]|uniref:hemin-degrading factor n=1 Tax=Planktotalea sp. TaxID=2029877 RepID=UPI0032998B8D
MTTPLSPNDIRIAASENPKLREKDLAKKLGITEAQLIASFTGLNVTRIDANPDTLIPAVCTFGEVMALTRTGDCVHEKVGEYGNYHPGKHAAMTLTEHIDLRIFPAQWVHGFAVVKEKENGLQRSIQVFDAAGDAIHKIYLRDDSDVAAYDEAIAKLATGETSQPLDVAPRKAPEPAKADPAKADILRAEWDKLTDTHQFLRLCSKLKMNRLGAYRIVGAPYARLLDPSAANEMLQRVQSSGIEIMLFVGNRGCIQIHTGPLKNLRMMGPWQNVMDPDFNLHLRLDTIAEVWAVTKPTQRGPAVSLEAFDKEGALIFQAFGVGKEGRNSRKEWGEIIQTLNTIEEAA